MATSTNPVLVAAGLNFYFSEAETAFPTHDKLDPVSMAAVAAWSNLGHTSKETPIAFTTEGGETTTIDSAIANNILALAAKTVTSIAIKALQLDVETMDLAYNGVHNPVARTYKVPTSKSPLTKRFLLVINDHYGKRIAVGGIMSISLGDGENIALDAASDIGLKGTVLDDSGFSLTWIGIDRSGAAPVEGE